ncbi:MAG: pyridoxamine 5'-phosphate oxidase family protein [Cyanobacteria bacterium P01_G01_bin.38]
MADAGWNRIESPFHQGEQDAQTRLGIREKVESIGRRFIRDYMPDQHREFYKSLPFLLIGTSDQQGWPWASIVVARPGFISSPDPQRLQVAARPLFGSPLQTTLAPGVPLGILGFQVENRRRNRLTGRVGAVNTNGFEILLDQSFGNCPQYIQTRAIEYLPEIDTPEIKHPIRRSDCLDEVAQTLIASADTLFIATAYAAGASDHSAQNWAPNLSHGADVSHRGGKPGFVKVEDDKTFVFPDFSGNLFFNTVGNLLINPKAGLLFIDFERGDLLYLRCDVEVIWTGPEVAAFVGAERLLRFRTLEAIRVEESLPLRFTFGEYSPSLERTGSWEEAAKTLAEQTPTSPTLGPPVEKPVNVYFTRSGVETKWTLAQGTLLELAEAMGIEAPFSCRQGNCGTCATQIFCGTVDYIRAPTGPHQTDEVLICSATPRSVSGEETCGENMGVVLNL